MLPAPYRSPWRLLGQDLRAVLADLGLRLRRLLRLNRQGDLPLPPFWPRQLAALFWPLLLATALAVVVALGVVVAAWLGQRQPQALPPSPAALPSPELGSVELAPATEESERATYLEPSGPEASVPGLSGPERPVPDPSFPEPAVSESTVAPPPIPLPSPPAGGQGLVAAVAAPAGRSLLRLQLKPGFAALAAAEQQRQADLWLQWAQDLGYEHLELRDRSDRLLAREVLVGNGMILLRSTPLS
ncbi:MAG: hypothetical protein R6W06_10975 [Prochlorococcaceae cyanobacterium]